MAKHFNPQHLIYVAKYEFGSLVSSMCFWLYWSLVFFSYVDAGFNLLVTATFQFGSFKKKWLHTFVLTIIFLHILTETKIIVMW